MEKIQTALSNAGYNLNTLLKNAKNLSTFATVDNTRSEQRSSALHLIIQISKVEKGIPLIAEILDENSERDLNFGELNFL